MRARGLGRAVAVWPTGTLAAWHGSQTPERVQASAVAHPTYPAHPSPAPVPLRAAGTFDLAVCCNGLMAGLSASTSNVGFVTPWASCINGALAGLLYVLTSHMLVSRPGCSVCDAGFGKRSPPAWVLLKRGNSMGAVFKCEHGIRTGIQVGLAPQRYTCILA